MTEPVQPGNGPTALDLPAGVHQLCRCGRSRQGWICDGAHLGSGRVSYELRLDEPTTVMLCGCGHSNRYPLCDGSHARRLRRRWWWWG
jgi:CDGSH iron-sulfur domain-containing protein 3